MYNYVLPLDAYFSKHCFLVFTERSFQVVSKSDIQSTVPNFAFMLQNILDMIYNMVEKYSMQYLNKVS